MPGKKLFCSRSYFAAISGPAIPPNNLDYAAIQYVIEQIESSLGGSTLFEQFPGQLLEASGDNNFPVTIKKLRITVETEE